MVEIFGPVTLFSYLSIWDEDPQATNSIDDTGDETKAEIFLQVFREDFVPWCLHGHTRSINEKLDLLIASIIDDFFAEQWSSIITYATNVNKCSESGTDPTISSSDILQAGVLAILIEKVKEKINKMKILSIRKIGCLPEHWQHKSLDSAAVSAAVRSSSTVSDARFIR